MAPAGAIPDGFVPVPCGRLDLASNERVAFVTKLFFLPKRLDVERMRDAYYDLLRAWPVLSSRLRKGGVHPDLWQTLIPEPSKLEEMIDLDRHGKFTSKAAVPMFSSNERAKDSIDDCVPLVRFARRTSQLPQNQEPVVINVDRAHLLKNFVHPAGVKSLNDYLNRDASILAFHVTNFADGAVFAFTAPHVCFDGYGAKSFMHAYLAVLKGDPIPEQPPFGYDPFEQLRPGEQATTAEAQSDTAPLAPSASREPRPPGEWRVLSVLDFLILAVYFAFDLLWTRPERKMQRVAVYVPPKVVSELKAQAVEDVRREKLGDADSLKMSTGAALHAWIVKNDLAPRVETAPDRLMTSATLTNMRFRLPKGLKAIHPQYLGNCLVPIAPSPVPTRDVASWSLGRIAYEIRHCLQEKASSATLRDFVRWQVWRGTPPAEGGGHQKGSMALFTSPAVQFTIVTDWSAFELFDLDFSYGFEKEGSATEQEPEDDTAEKQKEASVLAIAVDAHVALHHRNAWTVAGGRNGERWLLGYISEDERKHPDGWGRFADAKA